MCGIVGVVNPDSRDGPDELLLKRMRDVHNKDLGVDFAELQRAMPGGLSARQ